MWWNGFLFKKSCVKLQFFFNCWFFCGVLHFGVCFFFGPSTCFAPLIPFLYVKKPKWSKEGDPHKTWDTTIFTDFIIIYMGIFLCALLSKIIDFFLYLFEIYTFLWYSFSDVWPMCSIKALDKKNESQSIIVLRESWNAKNDALW